MVRLAFRDYLNKVIEDLKLSAWSKAHRLRGVEFDDESIEDYWDPKQGKCVGYPFVVYITDKQCESDNAHWWVCLGRDYNSKGELEKTMWVQYCDECYRNLNESSANANKCARLESIRSQKRCFSIPLSSFQDVIETYWHRFTGTR